MCKVRTSLVIVTSPRRRAETPPLGDYAAPGAMREDVAGVTVTRLGSSSPADNEADLETWRARVEAAAAGGVGTSDGSDEGPPARLAILVPFREDEDGTRGPQLDALLRRIRSVFRGVAPVVMCVATQSDDGRRFNRGQCLNAAFLHLRRTRPGWWDCLLYTSPSPRDMRRSRMPSSA